MSGSTTSDGKNVWRPKRQNAECWSLEEWKAKEAKDALAARAQREEKSTSGATASAKDEPRIAASTQTSITTNAHLVRTTGGPGLTPQNVVGTRALERGGHATHATVTRSLESNSVAAKPTTGTNSKGTAAPRPLILERTLSANSDAFHTNDRGPSASGLTEGAAVSRERVPLTRTDTLIIDRNAIEPADTLVEMRSLELIQGDEDRGLGEDTQGRRVRFLQPRQSQQYVYESVDLAKEVPAPSMPRPEVGTNLKMRIPGAPDARQLEIYQRSMPPVDYARLIAQWQGSQRIMRQQIDRPVVPIPRQGPMASSRASGSGTTPTVAPAFVAPTRRRSASLGSIPIASVPAPGRRGNRLTRVPDVEGWCKSYNIPYKGPKRPRDESNDEEEFQGRNAKRRTED
ncbi:hypothetical protein B0H16DRAFT_1884932 [Mycena metata]|uniref:Uncharacterized protein n=1 Tax=Mycena metata TaxID=1033252 RepID=A0AAD7NGA9_9AGAR|nr:hypothetical protein B0H16DRAFT_1884932 [Mycena metata]